jgi:hypothetical protein
VGAHRPQPGEDHRVPPGSPSRACERNCAWRPATRRSAPC